ncbi:LLM class flavin-dependent oxidoreductase, partial [Microbacterium sp. CPCC 204701]|uniref:LLM class flavin-dependent oxidoreductase n=1 Tax=Microbacterium sp. CPCC 204701 TaxID=2493084 RepID=UPI000FD8B288
MVFLGYHASHEQLPPSILLASVQDAERAGFDGAMCSDHLAPWGLAQGESGYTWSWLGAALATTSLSFGTVTAPGQRYHPVVTAQAIATLAEMFPGRFWCALGSGEAVNEHVTGAPWPPKTHRQDRLAQAVDVMRRLIAGERVDHDGAFRVHDARIWSRPSVPPPLFAAAASAPTAAWAADWADGVITVGHDPEEVGR